MESGNNDHYIELKQVAQRINSLCFSARGKNEMRKKYNDETLEKVFYYYSLAGNRMLTAAQAADCLNLSESSLFRVIADYRETISREKEEELIQKYQKVDVHSVLDIKETPKNHSNEKRILEDIAITLAEILVSINELKQYIMEKESPKQTKKEQSKDLEEIEEPKWEDLEELEQAIKKEKVEEKQGEPQQEAAFEKLESFEGIGEEQKELTLEELEQGIHLEKESQSQKKEFIQKGKNKKLDSTSMMCITQLNYMCKEINDLVSYRSMEKMWTDWEKICRGYGSRINPIYQRIWHQINKKRKEKITEDTIKTICDAQVEQMELELENVSSKETIKNISYTYYNWIRQMFEMCYLVQEPMTQQKTKLLYVNYLTILKNISNHRLEQIEQK